MDYKEESVRPTKAWRGVVEREPQNSQLNKDNAIKMEKIN